MPFPFQTSSKMVLVEIRGVRGGLMYYNSDTCCCFREISIRVGRRRQRKLICCTTSVINSIRWWDKVPIGSIVCNQDSGVEHSHAKMTLDDLRYLYVQHSVQYRLLIGNPDLSIGTLGRLLCRKLFRENSEQTYSRVDLMLSSCENRLETNLEKGVLFVRGESIHIKDYRLLQVCDHFIFTCFLLKYWLVRVILCFGGIYIHPLFLFRLCVNLGC